MRYGNNIMLLSSTSTGNIKRVETKPSVSHGINLLAFEFIVLSLQIDSLDYKNPVECHEKSF